MWIIECGGEETKRNGFGRAPDEVGIWVWQFSRLWIGGCDRVTHVNAKGKTDAFPRSVCKMQNNAGNRAAIFLGLEQRVEEVKSVHLATNRNTDRVGGIKYTRTRGVHSGQRQVCSDAPWDTRETLVAKRHRPPDRGSVRAGCEGKPAQVDLGKSRLLRDICKRSDAEQEDEGTDNGGE